MSKKQLTKDCASCNLCFVNDQNNFVCKWGRHKKIKVLDDKRVLKVCTLKR